MKPDPIDLIADERKRQRDEEGWDDEHDDEHIHCCLAMAAATYATPESDRHYTWLVHAGVDGEPYEVTHPDWVRPALAAFPWESNTPRSWPWGDGWWKPTPDDRIRELVKAGALIVAEIERLQRAEGGS